MNRRLFAGLVLASCAVVGCTTVRIASVAPSRDRAQDKNPSPAVIPYPFLIPITVPTSVPPPVPKPTTDPDKLETQIEIGDAFRKKKEFAKAEAAYLAASKSTEPATRAASVTGLKVNLQAQEEDRSWWFILAKSWYDWLVWLIKHSPEIAAILLLIFAYRKFVACGKQRGRCVVRISSASPKQAWIAEALKAAIQDRSTSGAQASVTGILGGQTMSVFAGTQSLATIPTLEVAAESVGLFAKLGDSQWLKVGTLFEEALQAPRFNVRMSRIDGAKENLLLATLEEDGADPVVLTQQIDSDDPYRAIRLVADTLRDQIGKRIAASPKPKRSFFRKSKE